MKNGIGSILSLIVAVILGIAWLSPIRNYDITRTQRERIEILELAKNSSDPAILKQAELVRIDIERDYNNILKQDVTNENTSEKYEDLLSSEDLSEIYRMMKSSLILAVPVGLIFGIAFAIYKEFQSRRESRREK
jgi:hypothetical protein